MEGDLGGHGKMSCVASLHWSALMLLNHAVTLKLFAQIYIAITIHC